MFRCKTKTWIICGCLPILLILLLSSCTNGSETSPTATISPFKQVVFQDGFDSQDGNWETFNKDYGSAFYQDGKLHIKNYTGLKYQSPSRTDRQFSDFALEVEMERVSGSSESWQSVYCRYSDENNYYIFRIGDNGKYWILKFVKGTMLTLRAATPSSHINTSLGVTNNVRVECIGDSLALYVNTFRVAQVSDGTFATGIVGFGVQSEGSEYTEVAFDNVVIWTP